MTSTISPQAQSPKSTAKQLARFRAHGLFGLFDHIVEFHNNEGITIIHAPNGYGKTVILRLISAFFGGSISVLREFEYDFLEFVFEDKSYVIVKQVPYQEDIAEYDTSAPARISIHYFNNDADKEEIWDPWAIEARGSEFISDNIGRYIPFISQMGSGEFINNNTREIFSYKELIRRYGRHLPVRMRGPGPSPKWVDTLRSSIHCRLIETQRLLTIGSDDPSRYPEKDSKFVPVVKNYSKDLFSLMERTLADSATLASSLDRTFPSRLLSRLATSVEPVSEDSLRAELSQLDNQRVRLTQAGLLDETEEASIIPQQHFDVATRRVLSEYISDTKRKLSSYDELLFKIELFKEIISNRFRFKKISIDRAVGFKFHDAKKRALPIESLSSGEQHELVLTYDLIFKTKKHALILIDEPEISLHIAWQKRFLHDLRRIIKLSPMNVLISTHSPQLIAGNMDLTVQLKGPKRDRLAAE